MTYHLLPGIIGKIERMLAELRVKPVDQTATPTAFAKKKSRVYMTPVVTEKGATLWFKSSLQDWSWVRSTLREEIRVHRIFAEYEKKHKPSFDSPTLLAGHDDRRGFVWFLRKYWDGLPAGDMNDEFGFSDQFFRRVSPLAMARALRDARGMTSFVRRRMEPETHGLRWYMNDWEYYRKTFWRPLVNHRLNPGWTKSDIDALQGWLLDQRRTLERHANVFTHGDLYPNNIMISPGTRRSIVLFDWELSHLNLASFDAVMVWLQAWRRPAWQTAFRLATERDLGSTPMQARLWSIATLSLATRLGAFAWHRLTNHLPDRYPPLLPKQRPRVEKMYAHMIRQLDRVRNMVR